MSGSFAASLSFRRAPIAFGLCLLAFLFAVEAKTVWYGSTDGTGSNVCAEKARPAATPEVVGHGVPTPDPAHPYMAFAAVPASTIAWLSRTRIPAGGKILHDHLPFFPAAYFSPSIFSRPPPAR
jgi:hypothetical protein